MAKRITKRRRELRKLGWETEVTRGGHLRCTHPDAAYPVFAASTPSDKRGWVKLLGDMRRATSDPARVIRAFRQPTGEGNIAAAS